MTDKLIEEIDEALKDFDPETDGSLVWAPEFARLLTQCRDRMRWVPCSERKPKKRGTYLVMHANDISPSLCNFGTSKGWGNGRYNRMDNPYRVTHWMPLPQSPEQEPPQ